MLITELVVLVKRLQQICAVTRTQHINYNYLALGAAV